MKGCLCTIWMLGALACRPVETRRPSPGRGAPTCESAECERACEASGDARACAHAAELYWDGANGHAFDPGKSLRYATRACDAGDGLGCAVLGRHHETGIGTAWAPAVAVADYEKACTAGAGLGCALLGDMYLRGRGVDLDREKALTYRDRARALWGAACEGAEPRWCTHAAALVGRDTDLDDPARGYSKRACDLGFAAGCVRVLGARLRTGAVDRGDAVSELSRLCDGGEPAACTTLAAIEREARGDRAAPRRAAQLILRACELGRQEACLEAGILAELGEVVPRDDAVKQRRLRGACERGLAEACLYLAQDAALHGAPAAEVERLDRRGCELGNAEACHDAMQRAAERHDDATALRFATDACRMGNSPGCQALIAEDAKLPSVPNYRQLRDYHTECEAGHSAACARFTQLEAADAAFARELLDAVRGQDAAAFGRLWSSHVEVTGLWFADRDCARKFARDFTLTPDRQPAFLRCLATLDAHVEPPDESGNVAVLVYDPGLGIRLGVRGQVVEQLWTDASRSDEPDAAPIDPDLLESHLASGTFDLQPSTAAGTAAPPGMMFVNLRICVGPSGRVDSTRIEQSTSASEGYARDLQAAAATWQFRPFVAGGKPVRACATRLFNDLPRSPATRSQPVRRAPRGEAGGPPLNVAPTALDLLRIGGQPAIVPDDATKTAISAALPGPARLVGSFKLCLSTSGRIRTITQLKSTGAPAYDRKLIHDMRAGWRYQPFVIDGAPAQVCTAVTFIYTQH